MFSEQSHAEPLEEAHINKWKEIQSVFKLDWPRGASIFAMFETQRELEEEGFKYSFRVFCPFGKASSGIVAFIEKDQIYKIIIHCPSDDTKDLENALKGTKLINWRRKIEVPFAPAHVLECIKRVVAIRKDVDVETVLYPGESFILQNNNTPFEERLPPDITFGILSPEHADLVNSCWPHKHPNSIWYFRFLINFKAGYGLFRGHQLISWVFVTELGVLGHLYTLETERRKGFADLILKMICNILLRKGKDVLAFVVQGNFSALNLYRKAGFMQYEGISWCVLKPKDV